MTAALLLALCASYGMQHGKNLTRQQTSERASAMARQVAAESSLMVAHSGKLLAAVALHSDSALLGRDCAKGLQELRAFYPGFRHVAMARPDGELLCSTAPSADHALRLGEERFFQRAIHSGEGAMSGLVECPVSREKGMVVLQPILKGRQVIGVLRAESDLEWFQELMRRIEPPAGTMVSLVDSEATIFASFPDAGRVGRKTYDKADRLESVARINGLPDGKAAFVKVSLLKAVAATGTFGALDQALLVFLVVFPLSFIALWAAGNVWIVGHISAFLAKDAPLELAGSYRARRDQREYAFEVSWEQTASAIVWEAKVRCEGQLVGLPSGELALSRGLDVEQAIRREVQAAIEHRLAVD